jgi:3-polyprenyl-4-hydroxybenzoate decarboxylase
MERKKIIVAITGASGAELGLYVLKALQLQDVEIHLILSEGAKRVIQAETIFTPEDFLAANCNIKLSISSVRISQVTARCGLGEEGAVGDRRGQAGRAGQAA